MEDPWQIDKAQLRQYFLGQRQRLSPQQWQQKSRQLCDHLRQWERFQGARTVCAYFSHRQEVDLSGLFTLPKVWGFPRCIGKQLVWSTWQPNEPLTPDKYGILTPGATAPPLASHQVDLILVPILAGDRQGYRLGYGGGYYDRLLAQPDWGQIPCLGIGFAMAIVDRLPHNPWDLPLGGLCSEKGYFLLDNGAKKKSPGIGDDQPLFEVKVS